MVIIQCCHGARWTDMNLHKPGFSNIGFARWAWCYGRHIPIHGAVRPTYPLWVCTECAQKQQRAGIITTVMNEITTDSKNKKHTVMNCLLWYNHVKSKVFLIPSAWEWQLRKTKLSGLLLLLGIVHPCFGSDSGHHGEIGRAAITSWFLLSLTLRVRISCLKR